MCVLKICRLDFFLVLWGVLLGKPLVRPIRAYSRAGWPPPLASSETPLIPSWRCPGGGRGSPSSTCWWTAVGCSENIAKNVFSFKYVRIPPEPKTIGRAFTSSFLELPVPEITSKVKTEENDFLCVPCRSMC